MIYASSMNRTRAARVAGEHSTTEPTMLTYGDKSQNYQNARKAKRKESHLDKAKFLPKGFVFYGVTFDLCRFCTFLNLAQTAS